MKEAVRRRYAMRLWGGVKVGNIITNINGKWVLKSKSGKVLLRKEENESFSEFEKRCAEYGKPKENRHES
jgi:hypothetical protein